MVLACRLTRGVVRVWILCWCVCWRGPILWPTDAGLACLLTDLDVIYKRSPFLYLQDHGFGKKGLWVSGMNTDINTGLVFGEPTPRCLMQVMVTVTAAATVLVTAKAAAAQP